MSCLSWQWHRARTLPMEPLWCFHCFGHDKAAANLSLRMGLLIVTVVRHHFLLFICFLMCSSFHCRRALQCSDRSSGKGCRVVPQSLREESLFLWSFIASKVLLQFSCRCLLRTTLGLDFRDGDECISTFQGRLIHSIQMTCSRWESRLIFIFFWQGSHVSLHANVSI